MPQFFANSHGLLLPSMFVACRAKAAKYWSMKMRLLLFASFMAWRWSTGEPGEPGEPSGSCYGLTSSPFGQNLASCPLDNLRRLIMQRVSSEWDFFGGAFWGLFFFCAILRNCDQLCLSISVCCVMSFGCYEATPH